MSIEDTFRQIVRDELAALALSINQPETILNTREAAELLQVHEDEVKKLAREDRLHGIKVGGGWRFLRSDVLAMFHTSKPIPRSKRVSGQLQASGRD